MRNAFSPLRTPVQEVPRRLPVRRAADEGRPAGERARRVGSQAVADVRQREAALLVLVEDTNARERAEQPVDGVRVRVGCRGERHKTEAVRCYRSRSRLAVEEFVSRWRGL